MGEPWLTIIGVGEDGLPGLSMASRNALAEAEIVFGGPRHLTLAEVGAKGQAWPIPFSVAPVLAARGRKTVVLASGDPFWHGAGGSLVGHLSPGEWQSYPAPSTFQLAANRLGWRLEDTLCLGLHAAPLARLRPLLAQGQRLICTVRDGSAVAELATYLGANGFGASQLHILESLGGAHEKITGFVAQAIVETGFSAPVAVAVDAVGRGLSRASGLPDELFANDGQITKRPFRALTLSALAPCPGETLWDIGTGSGSVSIEFLLTAPGSTAHALEADATRAARAQGNADGFGLAHRWHLHQGRALDLIATLPRPDVVFIGGGASHDLLEAVWPRLDGARLVVNAVTLETEALLYKWHGERGGQLLRIDIAEAAPLGTRHGWQASRPVVQWSVQP